MIISSSLALNVKIVLDIIFPMREAVLMFVPPALSLLLKMFACPVEKEDIGTEQVVKFLAQKVNS